MDCIFCKIGKHEIESEVVYEDDYTIAFMDINPVAPGHTMVIPKTHAENVLDADFDTVSQLFQSVKIVTRMIEKGIRPKGFNIGVNHGKQAGQAIDHIHVHIIPRFDGDGGGSMHTIVQNPPKEQTVEEIAGIIRSEAPEEKSTESKELPPEEPKETVSDDEIEEILRKSRELAEKEDLNDKEDDYHGRWHRERAP